VYGNLQGKFYTYAGSGQNFQQLFFSKYQTKNIVQFGQKIFAFGQGKRGQIVWKRKCA